MTDTKIVPATEAETIPAPNPLTVFLAKLFDKLKLKSPIAAMLLIALLGWLTNYLTTNDVPWLDNTVEDIASYALIALLGLVGSRTSKVIKAE